MDIYCTHCGEPWNVDDVVGDGVTLEEFTARGCAALGAVCAPRWNRARASASATLLELLGDDVDGVAALLEDFTAAGIL